MNASLQQKLLSAFDVEQREALGRIRANLLDIEKDGAKDAQRKLEESFRMAHSLKGASRVVELTEISSMAHHLESLFSEIRQGRVSCRKDVVELIHVFLNWIEDSVAALKTGVAAKPISPEALLALEALLSGGEAQAASGTESSVLVETSVLPTATGHAKADPEPEPTVLPKLDTMVRLNASSLDRLLTTASELLTCHRGQAGLAADYQGIERKAMLLQAELKHLRRDPSRVSEVADHLEREISDLVRELSRTRKKSQAGTWGVHRLGAQLEETVKSARMVPAETVFEVFYKMVRDLAGDEAKAVEFRVAGLEVQADRAVLQALKDPVMHILRNAIAHGLESPADRLAVGKAASGCLQFSLTTLGGKLSLEIRDDGRGLNPARIRAKAVSLGILTPVEATAADDESISQLIFEPGFSTAEDVTDIAGRGMGLSVVSEALRKLKGGVAVQTEPGRGACFTLTVPSSISAHRVVAVHCQGQVYGVPSYGIERLVRVSAEAVTSIEGKPGVFLAGLPLRVVALSELLGIPDAKVHMKSEHLALVILRSGTKRLAAAVDDFAEEGEAMIKELKTNSLARLTHLIGGMLRPDGSVCLVLNPFELIERHKRLAGMAIVRAPAAAAEITVRRILVVDDSFTTRTLEKSILEASGFHVTLAVDGAEALVKLKLGTFDLVISDVEMPNLDGFGLVAEMKRNPRTKNIPVIMVTSCEKPADKQRGLSLGANEYLLKQQFDQGTLLETIQKII